eukprot:1267393-Alexandrium_andersonii.AAC.1
MCQQQLLQPVTSVMTDRVVPFEDSRVTYTTRKWRSNTDTTSRLNAAHVHSSISTTRNMSTLILVTTD